MSTPSGHAPRRGAFRAPAAVGGLNEHPPGQHGAPDVRGHDPVHAHRLSGGLLVGGHRLVLRLHRHRVGAYHAGLSRQPHVSAVRHRLQRPLAGDPVLHVHGRDSRALRPRRRPARFDRTAVRSGARGHVLCGDFRRRHPRRDHRYGCRVGDRDGRHLDDADAQVRLLDAPHDGRHRCVGHHHPADPAFTGSGRACRRARAFGGRHVRGRHRAEPHPDRPVLRLGRHRQPHLAKVGAGAAARGAHSARLGALEKVPARHDPLARPDLSRARHDFHGARNPVRGGSDGRGGRDRACSLLRHPQLEAPVSRDGDHHAPDGHGRLHPDRRARVQPGLPGGGRQGVDRASAHRRCPADRLAS